jgi:hypothetical protein
MFHLMVNTLNRKRQSLKASSIYFYREMVQNNRSFYIFRFKTVIRYFIHCFRLLWLPLPLWFPNKCAGDQSSRPFLIRIPRLLSLSCNSKSCDVLFQDFRRNFLKPSLLAGTRVTVKLALRAGPLGLFFELAINNYCY